MLLYRKFPIKSNEENQARLSFSMTQEILEEKVEKHCEEGKDKSLYKKRYPAVWLLRDCRDLTLQMLKLYLESSK